MKLSTFALVPLLLVLFVANLGCGPAQTLPQPKPLPAGANYAGVWWSPQFEHMYIRQTGDQINGIYSYKTGGTIEGTANGNVLKFTWIDPGNKEEARRRFEGKGYLVLNKEGEKIVMKGEWGYNESYTGGGPWEAEWVRPMDPEDPRDLSELEVNR